jgi:hypothetical protein
MRRKKQTAAKDFTSLTTILQEAKKAYYAEWKKINAREEEVNAKKAELAKLGDFLKSQGVDPEELVKAKIEKSRKLKQARAKK